MRRIATVLITAACAGGLAACGSSGSTPKASSPSTSTVIRTPQGTIVLKNGSGATATLADKLKAASLGCSDYKDVPQPPQNLSSGIKDIGQCDIGHLGVFGSTSARDQWVATQLDTVKMGGCAEGTTWAVCVFPKEKVGKAQIQSALSGVSTS